MESLNLHVKVRESVKIIIKPLNLIPRVSLSFSNWCVRNPGKRMSTCKSGEGSVKLTRVKLPDTSVARAGKRFEFERV